MFFFLATLVGAPEAVVGGLAAKAGLALTTKGVQAFRAWRAGAVGRSTLKKASNQAFRAADQIGSWSPKRKHLPGSGGKYSKFAQGVDPRKEAAVALRRNDGLFLPNPEKPGSFRYIGEAGRTIGTKGETRIRIIIQDGRVINAFPVKSK